MELISVTSLLIFSLESVKFSTGTPFQKIPPLGLSSDIKKLIAFFVIDEKFSEDAFYINPGCISSRSISIAGCG